MIQKMATKNRIRNLAKELVPPGLLTLAKRLLIQGKERSGKLEFEYVPEGWEAEKTNAKIKGWNVKSVLEVYKAKWPSFLENIEDAKPFACSSESLTGEIDICYHNAIMSYAYALLFVSRGKTAISMLDWGGGIGHYYVISQALAPDLEIDYHCKDLPVLAEYGQKLFPQAHFYSGEECSYWPVPPFIIRKIGRRFFKSWQLLRMAVYLLPSCRLS